MRTVRVDNERPESLIALQGFPEEDEHLRCPLDRSLTTREVRIGRLHLIDCKQTNTGFKVQRTG